MTDVTTRPQAGAATSARTSGRMPALDGLRGAASFVVLIYHCLLCVPALTAAYRASDPAARTRDIDTVAWWLTNTPLRLLWAGTEAVFIFFVLSGLVLVLPALKPTFSWRTYYPRRLVRIYLPVFAALLFAVALLVVVPRHDMDSLSPWLAGVANDPTLTSLIKDAALLSGMSSFIGPLWSLRLEVLFSLLLPAYVLVARRAPAVARPWLAAGAVAASFVGLMLANSALFYLPMFAVGAVLAVSRDQISLWWAARSPTAHRLAVAATITMLVGPWVWAPWAPLAVTNYSLGLQLCGAAGVVVLAMVNPATIAALTSRPLLAAGRISFSLYLIHEPIVISVAALLGPGHGWWVLPIAAPVSVLVALAFYRWVEAPSHRFAQSLLRR